MGHLLSLVKSVEQSLHSRLGRWMQEVSLAGDKAANDIVSLQSQIRFPKPSEQGTLMTFRREASAVDIPLIRVDVLSGVTIGEVDVGVLPTMSLNANSEMYLRAPTLFLREPGGAIRHTIANAAATTWSTSAGTSLEFQYNTAARIKFDANGIGFNAAPPAFPLLATGVGHTPDDIIAALQLLGLVRQT